MGDQELATSGREKIASPDKLWREALAGEPVYHSRHGFRLGTSLELQFLNITGFVSVVRVEVSDINFVCSIN